MGIDQWLMPTEANRNDMGNFVLKRGTATIVSGQTTIAVVHGLPYTPTIDQIMICANSEPTVDQVHFWVHSPTATGFTIECTTNPSTNGLDFTWWIHR